MFFDSHAHYDDGRFDTDREALLESMQKKQVSYILNAASNTASSLRCIDLARKYDFIYASVGVHPHDAAEMTEKTIQLLKEYAVKPKVVAVGEIGLDYYYENSPRDAQQYWFRRQIQLAREIKMPIIVHTRDATQDTMKIVTEEKASEVGGVFHCYSGSVETAKQILEMGMYISIAGPITFKNATKAVEVVNMIPLDRLLIETDAPYLTPVPYRGKRNDSHFICYTAQKIADIKGVSIEEVAKQTMHNTFSLFGIKR